MHQPCAGAGFARCGTPEPVDERRTRWRWVDTIAEAEAHLQRKLGDV
jgi:hypothetical protein